MQTEGVEQQLSTLLEQQALIERRQSALDELVGQARAAGISVAERAQPRVPQRAAGTTTMPRARLGRGRAARLRARSAGDDDVISRTLLNTACRPVA